MATHFSVLAWETPWTEDPGGLQPLGSQKGQPHSSHHTYTNTHIYNTHTSSYTHHTHTTSNTTIPPTPSIHTPHHTRTRTHTYTHTHGKTAQEGKVSVRDNEDQG